MKVLLNAFDSASRTGPFPNLAIMKLATYHKSAGDEVGLVGKGIKRPDHMMNPDRVYLSCIFDWNRSQALGVRWMYANAEFIAGGSGIDLNNKLNPLVEACPPDYELYADRGVPGWPYALGFSVRGCNRKCGFCIVPQKEGRINDSVPMSEVVGDYDKVVLLDNNITQDPTIHDKLKWLAEWGGRVNFSQGLDARVIERKPELAGLLADVRFSSRTFNGRIFTMAYDHPAYKKIIGRTCGYLEDAGISLRNNVQFFVLCNYNTTFEQDLARVEHLRELGANPYVMVFDPKRAPLKIKRLQRWANRKQLFWVTDWAGYSRNRFDTELGEIQIGDF